VSIVDGTTPPNVKSARRRVGACLDDPRLSYRARGVYLAIAAGLDTIAELARESPREGRDAVRAAVQELLDLGYLRRETRTGHGSRLVRA
jgi:hypothetical protein